MAEARVVPSGKVYRQMFDAQVLLSLSLHETRRRRVANEGYLTGEDPMSRDTDSGPHQHTGANQGSEDMTIRNQTFSGIKCARSEEWADYEEIRGLPDNVVSAKTGSDIIKRLMEKKERDHIEAVAQLQRDLSVLSAEYEALFKQTGEDILCRLSECDDTVERLIQKTGNITDYWDLHEFWNTVKIESGMKRKWIQELDETFTKFEAERALMISAVLKKYAAKLEKISYIMPCDVHRLIDNEAMMINQALLANRRAIAKLHMNLMERHLQKDALDQLNWETKIQDWKKVKVLAAVGQFKDFMNSPEIKRSENVQDTLNSMWRTQEMYSEQRVKILQQIRTMIPPRCSKSSVTEWYSSLSSVNEQIDCMHIDTVLKLRKYYENTWQECLAEVEHFKNKVGTYGFTSDDTQLIVNAELLPIIGECQTQTEEHLGKVDKAFENLAKTSALLSKSLFKYMRGAAHLWEMHRAALQQREQQLQDHLEEVRYSYDQENQKKEAQLDVLLDKLRQESTEEGLRTALEKTLAFLEEVKNGYIICYKEKIDTVESYPAVVLEEIQTYSAAVSRYFTAKEVYNPDISELQTLFPSIKLDATIKRKKTLENQRKKYCPDVSQQDNPQEYCSVDLLFTKEDPDCGLEFRNSEANETFTTAKGNVFNCYGFLISYDGEVNVNLEEVERVLYPQSLLIELQKVLREEFFNHLEERYCTVLSNTVTIVKTKKEELKSELDLLLHLHQPRARRIEMDIHDVRVAELILHRDRVDRHCKGVLQALADFQTDFTELQDRLHKLTENFRTEICKLENTFNTATKSDKLVKLGTSLQTSVAEHMNVIQESQRHFRQNSEVKFEGLRESNAQLMKSFKLFSEGGNFTPKEIEVYQKRLEKSAKRIDSADEALMLDMEGTESKCLEQAKNVVKKCEEKIHFLTVDLMFLEKIQGVMTNTQVQIKAEAMKSNMQKKKINGIMSELEEMIHVCGQPNLDKGETSEDISSLTASMIEELRKRCQYLDCFLDPSMAVPLPDVPLQGAFAVAARPRSHKQEKVVTPAEDSILQPSRMGVPFMNDMAVGVIQGLLRITKSQASHDVSADVTESNPAAVTVPLKPSSAVGSVQRSERGHSQSALKTRRKSAESVSSQSVRRFTKPSRFDKRFQVFGSKPEDQQGNYTFKGVIGNILWEANDILLQVAEAFYKKKERRPISRPQYIKESFEQCAEDLNKRLLVYQSQSHEYHNNCVQEFQQQLMDIEEHICEMPAVLLRKLRDQYLMDLSRSVTRIHQHFEQFQQQSEQKKTEHRNQLSVRLSHPACEDELTRLITAEQDRQEEQKQAIQNIRLELQACIRKNADAFVTALATLTESVLFQLDSMLTPDNIQGTFEPKRENITLIRRKQIGTLKEDRPLLERGSRTWPGIYYFGATDDSQRAAATITTAKTTIGHLKAVEVRNALHQSYEVNVTKELEIAEKFSQKQEAEVLRWQEHWSAQLKTLSTLTSE